MNYLVAADETGNLCIFDGEISDDAKVGQVQTFEDISTPQMTDNICALLNFKEPPHAIRLGGQPRFIRTFGYVTGFEIRDGLGEAKRVCTFALNGDYAERLQDRLTPDFFVGLCDAMPAAPMLQPTRSTPQPARP
jgi:hypothetical protein